MTNDAQLMQKAGRGGRKLTDIIERYVSSGRTFRNKKSAARKKLESDRHFRAINLLAHLIYFHWCDRYIYDHHRKSSAVHKHRIVNKWSKDNRYGNINIDHLLKSNDPEIKARNQIVVSLLAMEFAHNTQYHYQQIVEMLPKDLAVHESLYSFREIVSSMLPLGEVQRASSYRLDNEEDELNDGEPVIPKPVRPMETREAYDGKLFINICDDDGYQITDVEEYHNAVKAEAVRTGLKNLNLKNAPLAPRFLDRDEIDDNGREHLLLYELMVWLEDFGYLSYDPDRRILLKIFDAEIERAEHLQRMVHRYDELHNYAYENKFLAPLMLALAEPKPDDIFLNPLLEHGHFPTALADIAFKEGPFSAGYEKNFPIKGFPDKSRMTLLIEKTWRSDMIGLSRILLSGIIYKANIKVQETLNFYSTNYPEVQGSRTMRKKFLDFTQEPIADIVIMGDTSPLVVAKNTTTPTKNAPIPTSSLFHARIQAMLLKLKHGGRAVIHTEERFLYDNKGGCSEIRKWLCENFKIKALISLPMMPQTTRTESVLNVQPTPIAREKTALLVIENSGATDQIRYLDATHYINLKMPAASVLHTKDKIVYQNNPDHGVWMLPKHFTIPLNYLIDEIYKTEIDKPSIFQETPITIIDYSGKEVEVGLDGMLLEESGIENKNPWHGRTYLIDSKKIAADNWNLLQKNKNNKLYQTLETIEETLNYNKVSELQKKYTDLSIQDLNKDIADKRELLEKNFSEDCYGLTTIGNIFKIPQINSKQTSQKVQAKIAALSKKGISPIEPEDIRGGKIKRFSASRSLGTGLPRKASSMNLQNVPQICHDDLLISKVEMMNNEFPAAAISSQRIKELMDFLEETREQDSAEISSNTTGLLVLPEPPEKKITTHIWRDEYNKELLLSEAILNLDRHQRLLFLNDRFLVTSGITDEEKFIADSGLYSKRYLFVYDDDTARDRMSEVLLSLRTDAVENLVEDRNGNKEITIRSEMHCRHKFVLLSMDNEPDFWSTSDFLFDDPDPESAWDRVKDFDFLFIDQCINMYKSAREKANIIFDNLPENEKQAIRNKIEITDSFSSAVSLEIIHADDYRLVKNEDFLKVYNNQVFLALSDSNDFALGGSASPVLGHLLHLRNKGYLINSEYVSAYLHSSDVQEQLKSLQYANHPLSDSSLLELEIYLPPLFLQDSVVTEYKKNRTDVIEILKSKAEDTDNPINNAIVSDVKSSEMSLQSDFREIFVNRQYNIDTKLEDYFNFYEPHQIAPDFDTLIDLLYKWSSNSKNQIALKNCLSCQQVYWKDKAQLFENISSLKPENEMPLVVTELSETEGAIKNLLLIYLYLIHSETNLFFNSSTKTIASYEKQWLKKKNTEICFNCFMAEAENFDKSTSMRHELYKVQDILMYKRNKEHPATKKNFLENKLSYVDIYRDLCIDNEIIEKSHVPLFAWSVALNSILRELESIKNIHEFHHEHLSDYLKKIREALDILYDIDISGKLIWSGMKAKGLTMSINKTLHGLIDFLEQRSYLFFEHRPTVEIPAGDDEMTRFGYDEVPKIQGDVEDESGENELFFSGYLPRNESDVELEFAVHNVGHVVLKDIEIHLPMTANNKKIDQLTIVPERKTMNAQISRDIDFVSTDVAEMMKSMQENHDKDWVKKMIKDADEYSGGEMHQWSRHEIPSLTPFFYTETDKFNESGVHQRDYINPHHHPTERFDFESALGARIILKLRTPDAENCTVDLRYTATDLNDRRIENTASLEFKLIENPTRIADTGTKIPLDAPPPYQAGPALSPDKNKKNALFYGRDKIVEKIKTDEKNMFILEGNRRSGKSSIMEHLAKIENKTTFYFIADLQTIDTKEKTSKDVFKKIIYEMSRAMLGKGIEILTPNNLEKFGGNKEASLHDIVTFNKELSEHYKSNVLDYNNFSNHIFGLVNILKEKGFKRVMILLDEFNKIDGIKNEDGSESDIKSNLRGLFQDNPTELSGVLANALHLKQQRKQYEDPLFGFAQIIDVDSLEYDDAKKLIEEPLKEYVRYHSNVIDHILNLTSSEPYLIQYFGLEIFNKLKKEKTSKVTLSLVDSVADKFVSDQSHFGDVYETIDSNIKKYIIVRCHQNDKMSSAELYNELAENGYDGEKNQIDEDIKSLRDIKLLDLDRNEKYKLTSPLFGKWLDAHVDVPALKESAIMEQKK